MSHNTPAFRGRSQAFGAAMSRSAEKRQCPKCGRKSAIVRTPEDDFLSAYCRWDDCNYVRVRGEHNTGQSQDRSPDGAAGE